jgi:uncharacterized membrane protein
MPFRSFRQILQRSRESFWLRPAIFAGMAIGTLVLTPFVAPVLPDKAMQLIGLNGVYDLLNALANTLLAVAIFSLGIMASSIQAAATASTPRARPLLLQDRTAQNAISTFIGGFIFSIVGIVGLSTNYYGDASRVVLFIASCLVIAVVIFSLIRWIGKLSSLGDIAEVIDRLEEATCSAFASLAKDPFLGGQPVERAPEQGFDLLADQFGYLEHVDGDLLGTLAEEYGLLICLIARPGDLVDITCPLLRAEGPISQHQAKKLRSAFTICPDRKFEHDPRFGLVVLSEVASRALSPGINDQGTAIDVIGTATRILIDWSDALSDKPIRYANLRVPSLSYHGILTDAFGWIARDGSDKAEVQSGLQRAYAALAAHSPARFAEPARILAAEALSRARDAIPHKPDYERLAELSTTLGLRPGRS